jgi:hypothetical protein
VTSLSFSRLVFSPRALRVCSLTKTCPIKSVNIINLRLMRERVCVCVCVFGPFTFRPILRISVYIYTYTAAAWEQSARPAATTCRVRGSAGHKLQVPILWPHNCSLLCHSAQHWPRSGVLFLSRRTLLCCNIAANEISFIVLPVVIKFTHNIKLFRTYARTALESPTTPAAHNNNSPCKHIVDPLNQLVFIRKKIWCLYIV